MPVDSAITSLIVMGVSGCGKSSVAAALASHIDAPFFEGDSLHDAHCIEKMSRGEALTDIDRWPWLQRVGEQLSACDSSAVISCSALRRVYRQHIMAFSNRPVAFIHLYAEQFVVAERLAERQGHFMPSALLESQYKALEPLQFNEKGVVIDISQSLERVIADSIKFAETLLP